mmetsp:Transcript_54168/g.100051  ORF Transcript_54168/g.100051 Transcript_54168/m.100051 type:complete len:582 (-) Transcript_54168:68-1813(-)
MVDRAYRAGGPQTEALLAQAAADTLTWLAGIELLISEKQQEYAQRMLQLQLEAAVPNEERDSDRITSLRASARESLDEVRELLGLLRSALDQLPSHLHDAPDNISVEPSIPDLGLQTRPGGQACPSMAEVAAASAFVERLPSIPSQGCRSGIPTDCPICLHALFDAKQPARSEEVVALPCGNGTHCFHRHCIHEWVRLSACCPLCRKGLWCSSPPGTPKEKGQTAHDEEEIESVPHIDASASETHAHMLRQPPTGWTAWADTDVAAESARSPTAGRDTAGEGGSSAADAALATTVETPDAEAETQATASESTLARTSSELGPSTKRPTAKAAPVPRQETFQSLRERRSASSSTGRARTGAARRREGSQPNMFSIQPLTRGLVASQSRSSDATVASQSRPSDNTLGSSLPQSAPHQLQQPRGFVSHKLRSSAALPRAMRSSATDLQMGIAGQEIRPNSAAERVRKHQPSTLRPAVQEELRPGTAAASFCLPFNGGQAAAASWFPPTVGTRLDTWGASGPLQEDAVSTRRQETPACRPITPTNPVMAGPPSLAMRRQASRQGMPSTLMGTSMSGVRRQLVAGL